MAGVSEGGNQCANCGKYHRHRDNDWIVTAAKTFLCGNDICWRQYIVKKEADAAAARSSNDIQPEGKAAGGFSAAIQRAGGAMEFSNRLRDNASHDSPDAARDETGKVEQ